MTGKDKEIRTDGRTDKEIRTIAISGQISNLTNNQYDRFVDHIEPALYNRTARRHDPTSKIQRSILMSLVDPEITRKSQTVKNRISRSKLVQLGPLWLEKMTFDGVYRRRF